jgi:preprotein translocase subunit SecE
MAGKSLDAEESKYSIGQVKQFAKEVKTEIGKVVWPEKKHTIGSTATVVFLVFLMAIYLGGVDLLLGSIVSAILR